MRLRFRAISGWPKLGWVVRIRGDEAEVLHGPMVETAEDWAAEAVWAGDFRLGDFDRTDLVFGSGVRRRGGTLTFVGAGTVFDRLWHAERSGVLLVANTLAGLLAAAGEHLLSDHGRYSEDVRSIHAGLDAHIRSIPAEGGAIGLVYFRNLTLRDGRRAPTDKPDAAPRFETYGQYEDFLRATAAALGSNAADASRRYAVKPLTSISSGYDSTAAATVARHAGCRRAVTIRKATSLWRGSDSGEDVARYLDLECLGYDRVADRYPDEPALWAGEGRPGIINWTQFDYDEPLCLFFTGIHGEKMWDRVAHDHPDPFVRRSPASLGICEWRLHRGVFQCPVPFWGARHSHELHAITAAEMAPWSTGDDYDKPIARRIVEDAGVPREAFGQVNRNTSLEATFLWPYSPDAQADYAAYRRDRGLPVASAARVRWIRRAAHLDHLLYLNVTRRLPGRRRRRPWDRLSDASVLFRWANETLARRAYDGAE